MGINHKGVFPHIRYFDIQMYIGVHENHQWCLWLPFFSEGIFQYQAFLSFY